MRLADVPTPALCVDLDILERNLERMAAFFRDRPCDLRPHFKAHKTPAIARLQAEAGCAGFTCATVKEAEVLAFHGFTDLLIANEVCDPAKIARLRELAVRAELTVAVDSLPAVALLVDVPVAVVVDVNVGLPRCGVPPEGALEVARAAADAGLPVRGVMGYEGHAMIVSERPSREEVARTSMATLLDVAGLLSDEGFEVSVVSAGGTGTYDISGTIPGLTEIQAGSYALMDTAYAELGLPFEEALRCLTTVVSVQGPIGVLDAGLKALAVDHGNPEPPAGSAAQVLFLSDEHTTLVLHDDPFPRPGERTWLRPSHVDPTVNLHERLYAVRGGEVEEIWDVEGRGW